MSASCQVWIRQGLSFCSLRAPRCGMICPLDRLGRRPMRAVQPLAEVLLDRDIARVDKGAAIDGAEDPGEFALGVLALTANRIIADLPLASGIGPEVKLGSSISSKCVPFQEVFGGPGASVGAHRQATERLFDSDRELVPITTRATIS